MAMAVSTMGLNIGREARLGGKYFSGRQHGIGSMHRTGA